AALKKGRLDANGYRAMIDSTTRLNTPGARLAGLEAVHALTDVTGFGLLGHALEMCRGPGLRAEVSYADLPWLAPAPALARDGIRTGASERNWNACGAEVSLDAGLPDEARALLTDPQTSGGLLVACAPEAADEVLALLRADGFAQAARIGRLEAGPAHIRVSCFRPPPRSSHGRSPDHRPHRRHPGRPAAATGQPPRLHHRRHGHRQDRHTAGPGRIILPHRHAGLHGR